MESLVPVLERLLGIALAHEWLWRIALAFGLLVVGAWIARRLSRVLDRLMLRFEVEDILRNFLRNLAYAIGMVVVFIAALDFAGVPTTSLLAVVGAAGLAIGLALKDSLANIASGVMLIVLRPFRAGDSVLIAGHEGVVESVRIFQTWMVTVDNREVILPNSQITSAPIVNFTGRGERRLDISVPMAFGEDFAALRAAMLALAAANPRVKPSPAPEVLVATLGEGTVSVQLRAWVAARDFNAAQSELLEAALSDYARRGRRAPLPSREVHVHHHGAPESLALSAQEAIKPSL
jgi:small-conductance mechanosensitive channel